jgi:ethanolamine phosphate phosphodiesterase
MKNTFTNALLKRVPGPGPLKDLIDENTYPRRGLSMWLTKVFTNRYMRRNFKLLMSQDPGTAIFLGDLMDGGREWEDKTYTS